MSQGGVNHLRKPEKRRMCLSNDSIFTYICREFYLRQFLFEAFSCRTVYRGLVVSDCGDFSVKQNR